MRVSRKALALLLVVFCIAMWYSGIQWFEAGRLYERERIIQLLDQRWEQLRPPVKEWEV